MTQDQLFERIATLLNENFEIDRTRIVPAARLFEDLDIDSIDAVDLLVQLKPLLGGNISPDAFKSVRTVQDVVNALYGLLAQQDQDA
jgi:acyl carrier protein